MNCFSTKSIFVWKLKQMKELMDHLAVLSAPVCEGDQVVTLLGSLPQMYSMLVTV